MAVSATSKRRRLPLAERERGTCANPRCGERFEKLRADARYCSRPCQSRTSNSHTNKARATTREGRGGTNSATSAFHAQNPQHSLGVAAPPYAAFGLRAVPRLKGETLVWEAANEVTHKVRIAGKNANANALGFVMKIESPSLRQDRAVPAHDDGWWGRVKDGATEFAFGPATLDRAKAATEAFLRREPLLPPRGDERCRSGALWTLIGGR